MKPRKKAGGQVLTLALLILTTLFARGQTNVSREYSVFQFSPPSAPNGVEAISREYSVFQFSPSSAPNGVEGISREYSVFQFSPSSAPNGVEGISREYSVFQFSPSSAPNGVEAISREVSGYNYGSNRLNVVIGSTVVRAGTPGGVPVTLSTIVPMSNVVVAVDFPPDRLSNWTVQAQSPYAGGVLVSNGNRLYLTFSNATFGQTIQSSNQVLGQILFASASNQPSAFLPLPVTGVTAALVNANAFAPSRTTAGNGEVVVLHTNSLLRLSRGTAGLEYLTLYGLPEISYTIYAATNLNPPIVWQPVYADLTPVNFEFVTPGFSTANSMMFFQASQ